MLGCVIPLIHPQHTSVTNYTHVETCLYHTLHNLLSQTIPVKIVVVAHRIPQWAGQMSNKVHFITVQAEIFRFLKDLDDETISLHDIHGDTPYDVYFTMRGQFHNKDKGLKYYIGWRYFSLLPTPPTFIGLIDGDDFIHTDVGRYLESMPPNIDAGIVQQGYIMSILIEGGRTRKIPVRHLQPLEDFSDVCGSNRFFRFSTFTRNLQRRIPFPLQPKQREALLKHKRIGNAWIGALFECMYEKPEAWTILPRFLGVHRILEPDLEVPPHNFQYSFCLQPIPFRAAIKVIHAHNHSTVADDGSELIERYKRTGQIRRDGPTTEQLLGGRELLRHCWGVTLCGNSVIR